jgi:hypothetical protein
LQKLLLLLGINANFNGPYKKKYFELKITGKENLIKFSKDVNFISKKKKEKLRLAVITYKK